MPTLPIPNGNPGLPLWIPQRHALADTPDRSTGAGNALEEFSTLLITHNVFNPAQRNAAPGVHTFDSVNTTASLKLEQWHTVQVLVTTSSTLSICAALMAIYWFCLMKRNFRRDLIVLLIVGDLWKSLWFLVFCLVTFAAGPVGSQSPFCQTAGYFLQVGRELCDYAILFMSLHMALQIFPSAWAALGHDGLYRVRFYVYATWLLLPNVMAGLAFVNPKAGYMAQAAFCALPLRPYWYRLALSWVPRYLIWFYVMSVAIRIYRHVGYEFRVFAKEGDQSSNLSMLAQSAVERANNEEQVRRGTVVQIDGASDKSEEDLAPNEKAKSSHAQHNNLTRLTQTNVHESQTEASGSQQDPTSSVPETARFSKASSAGRRQSVPTWSTSFGGPSVQGDMLPPLVGSKSNPPSRRGSRPIASGVAAEDFQRPSFNFPPHRVSIATSGSLQSLGEASVDGITSTPLLRRIDESQTMTQPRNIANDTPAMSAVQQRRRAIQRQLRLLFIYPCVYIFCWTIPFVVQCLNYSDYWAQHPIFVLSALSSFAQSIMGLVDVLVFSWRERPWRHISGSDGTFVGSLCWWRFARNHSWYQNRGASSTASDIAQAAGTDPESDTKKTGSGLFSSVRYFAFGPAQPSTRPQNPSAVRPKLAHKRNFSGSSDRRVLEAEHAHERLALERQEWEEKKDSMQRLLSVMSLSQQQAPGRKEWFDRRLSEDSLTAHGLTGG